MTDPNKAVLRSRGQAFIEGAEPCAGANKEIVEKPI